MNDKRDTEAWNKVKGFKLQKLKAVSLMLHAIEKIEEPWIYLYVAIEHKGDVHIRNSFFKEPSTKIEEVKNYNPKTLFTFQGNQILNALVNFLDIWIDKTRSPSIIFGFYSTSRIGQEIKSKKVDKLEISLPDKPILDLLMREEFNFPNLLPSV